jgi:hypothetical protein
MSMALSINPGFGISAVRTFTKSLPKVINIQDNEDERSEADDAKQPGPELVNPGQFMCPGIVPIVTDHRVKVICCTVGKMDLCSHVSILIADEIRCFFYICKGIE